MDVHTRPFLAASGAEYAYYRGRGVDELYNTIILDFAAATRSIKHAVVDVYHIYRNERIKLFTRVSFFTLHGFASRFCSVIRA